MVLIPANDPNVINVKTQGAKGDGVTDDSQAFIAAIAAAESMARRNPAPSSDGNRLGSITIYIPSGSYLIRSPEAMIRSSYSVRTIGLQFQGAGIGNTQILFQPQTPGGYLMSNRDAWMYLRISDISFDSNNALNNLLDSYSSGGAQKYTVERCQFTGSWNSCFYLEGNDTNSEYVFYGCTWLGSYSRMMYISASTGSEQFVNYNFFACNFEVSQGDFLYLERGGNVGIFGGSFIHTSGGGTFFRLLGSNHGDGVERFLCIGARMEHRTNASLLMECEWGKGTVSFINVDLSSSFYLRDKTAVNAIMRSVNVAMPSYKFDNCRLIGTHQFQYYVNTWSPVHNIVYENCTFEQHADPSTFIAYANPDGNANKGGRPVIAFRNCRGTGPNVWETDYGYGNNVAGMTSRKIVSLKTPDGYLPFKSNPRVTVTLPLNAVVTDVKLYWPAGAVTSQSKSWTFTVRTSETSPTVLASASGGNKTALAAGNLTEVHTFFPCGSDAKRTLVFECNASVDQTIVGLCLIEYLG